MEEKKDQTKKQEDVSNEMLGHEHGLTSILCDTLEIIAEKKANEPIIKKPRKATFGKWLENIFYSIQNKLTVIPSPRCECGSYSLKYNGVIGVRNIDNIVSLTRLYTCKKCGKDVYKTKIKK